MLGLTVSMMVLNSMAPRLTMQIPQMPRPLNTTSTDMVEISLNPLINDRSEV